MGVLPCFSRRIHLQKKICKLLKLIANNDIHLPRSNEWFCIYVELKNIIGDVYNADNDLIFYTLDKCKKLYKINRKKDKVLRVSSGVYSGNYVSKTTETRIFYANSLKYAKKLNKYQVDNIKCRYDNLTFETITTE